MTLTRTVTTEHEITLPEPAYATLLSADEFQLCKQWIRPADYSQRHSNIPIAWYFRTPGDTPNRITCAYAGYVAETDPGWENPGSEQLAAEGCGTGNRPVLVFEKSLFAAGAKPGDRFSVGLLWPFTVLSDTLAICDEYISTEVFDTKANDYETSAIKKRVDGWFQRLLKLWRHPKEGDDD